MALNNPNSCILKSYKSSSVSEMPKSKFHYRRPPMQKQYSVDHATTRRKNIALNNLDEGSVKNLDRPESSSFRVFSAMKSSIQNTSNDIKCVTK